MSEKNKLEGAIEVLMRARDQLVGEIFACGSGGNVGRAQSYAPVLVNLSNALSIVESMVEGEDAVPDSLSNDVKTRMAQLRARKGNKAAQA